MRPRNRHRYRNSVRLPVILFFVIVGGLVGTRWVKEIRAQHATMALSTQVRDLDRDIVTLRRDIKDLNSRYSALITEDVLMARLRDRKLDMHNIETNTIISLETDLPTNLAANLEH